MDYRKGTNSLHLTISHNLTYSASAEVRNGQILEQFDLHLRHGRVPHLGSAETTEIVLRSVSRVQWACAP